MQSIETFYPENPVGLPKNFTALPSTYKIKVAAAIGAILLFIALYIGLVVAMGYLLRYAVFYDMVSINKLTILLKIGAIAGAGMLLVFTLKFLFKLKNVQPENRVRLDMDKNPSLKKFVDKICEDTKAPKPRHIFADPDVNAYVSYSNMWLSLFFPVKKNLTIGLGLVSCLNLTEFKAVVAHEFGHFAQRSMKVGSYINSANTIIHDMIYTRDSWDNALDTWRRSDIRLAAAAWVITPVIWVIRQLLSLFYQLLNLVYSSLSREMEFNADKVAVSTTGSEAIVSALWKLDSGNNCWNETLNHVYAASQKDLFVKNVYHHNNLAFFKYSETLRSLSVEMTTDTRGGKLFFGTSANSKVGMYTSHPPNDHREHNAKTPFIPCTMDERSAWVLFDDAAVIQEELTSLVYASYFAKKPSAYSGNDVFQSFVQAETAGNELLSEYHNTFDERFINIPESDSLAIASHNMLDAESKITQLKLELAQLMKPVQEVNDALTTVREIAGGTSTLKSFQFQGQEFKKKEMELVFEKVLNLRNDLFLNSFKDWDLNYFAAHLKLAQQKGSHEKLLSRYTMHNKLTSLHQLLLNGQAAIYDAINALQEHDDVQQVHIDDVSRRITGYFKEFDDGLKGFNDSVFVALPNVDSATELRKLIVPNDRFTTRSGDLFKSNTIDPMLQELAMAISSVNRLEQKSIVGILKVHHDLMPTLQTA